MSGPRLCGEKNQVMDTVRADKDGATFQVQPVFSRRYWAGVVFV